MKLAYSIPSLVCLYISLVRGLRVGHGLRCREVVWLTQRKEGLRIKSTWTDARLIGDKAYDLVANFAQNLVVPPIAGIQSRSAPVATALRNLQGNMDALDTAACRVPQLTGLELGTLIATVAASIVAPTFLPTNVVEVLVPSLAAVSASIGLSAEYIGKVEAAKGKEISALAMQAAAEAEALLAIAERSKAILPLCVGIATTASAFALLAPSFVRSLNSLLGIELLADTMLLFPVLSVLAAAIAGLATQECREVASRASGVGARRFAKSNQVGRTWLSASEQVEMTSLRMVQKWTTFAVSVLPAPLVAALCPGTVSSKAVICSAIAAAQAAFYVAICEYFLATAVEAVALKARSAAVADTYANQGARAGAILPFTSALAGLCAAASAAAVELLPFVSSVQLQCALAGLFPMGAVLFAAAASVAKSRCEVDALASSYATSRGLSPEGELPRNPVREVRTQVVMVLLNTWDRIIRRVRRLGSSGRMAVSLLLMRKGWRGARRGRVGSAFVQ